MAAEVPRIQELLIRAYEGDAWHGPSVRSVVSNLSASQSLLRLGRSHNAAELLRHMTAWRNFVAERLSDHHSYELSDSENWCVIDHQSDEDWQLAQTLLHQSQHRLLSLLDKANEHQLAATVANRTYDYYTMLHGSIHHDLYHLGQIQLLTAFGK